MSTLPIGCAATTRIPRSGSAGSAALKAFVNAVAFIAHTQDHHPDLSVHYNPCIVRLSTHDVGGISATDIDCAARIDALLAAP